MLNLNTYLLDYLTNIRIFVYIHGGHYIKIVCNGYSFSLKSVDFALQPFTDSKFTNAYDRLTSQSPDKFWTSGQWMTERKGGSDVGEQTACMYYQRVL